jgi:ABC-type bacteriocin/lantibiotic exporter with double-glycine peptidase domain
LLIQTNFNERYYEKYAVAYKINLKTERSRFVKMKSASLITVLISMLFAPISSGAITAGMFIGFVTASFGLAQMMSWELTNITSELANKREYLRDLSTFGQLSETSGTADLPAVHVSEPTCIEFRDVTFAYPDTDAAVLKISASGCQPTSIMLLSASMAQERQLLQNFYPDCTIITLYNYTEFSYSVFLLSSAWRVTYFTLSRS